MNESEKAHTQAHRRARQTADHHCFGADVAPLANLNLANDEVALRQHHQSQPKISVRTKNQSQNPDHESAHQQSAIKIWGSHPFHDASATIKIQSYTDIRQLKSNEQSSLSEPLGKTKLQSAAPE